MLSAGERVYGQLSSDTWVREIGRDKSSEDQTMLLLASGEAADVRTAAGGGSARNTELSDQYISTHDT